MKPTKSKYSKFPLESQTIHIQNLYFSPQMQTLNKYPKTVYINKFLSFFLSFFFFFF